MTLLRNSISLLIHSSISIGTILYPPAISTKSADMNSKLKALEMLLTINPAKNMQIAILHTKKEQPKLWDNIS